MSLERLLTTGSVLPSKCPFWKYHNSCSREYSAISPTPPFSRLSFLRVEGVLAPLFLTSLFVPQYMVYKGTGFAIGFGLFGDPIITRCLTLLNEKFPTWMEMLEPKK